MRNLGFGLIGLVLLLAGCGSDPSQRRSLSYRQNGEFKSVLLNPGDPIVVPPGATLVSLDANWLTDDGIAQDLGYLVRMERGVIKKIAERSMTYNDAQGLQNTLVLKPGEGFPAPPPGARFVRRDGELDPNSVSVEEYAAWKATMARRRQQVAANLPPAPAKAAPLPSGREQVMTYVDAQKNTIRLTVPAGAAFPDPPAGATYVTRNGIMDPNSLPSQEQLSREYREFHAKAEAQRTGQPAKDTAADAKKMAGLTAEQWAKLDEKSKLALEKAAAKPRSEALKPAGRVGTKMTLTPEPDLGPAVKLNIPRKPSDKRGAFLYRQYVEQHIQRIEGEPRERDQKAIEMMARWCANPYGSESEVCLLWKDVPWRAPLADYVYEHNEARVLMASQIFMALGRRFEWNADQLEAGGYSAYTRCRAQVKAALEILKLGGGDPILREAAQKRVDAGVALLPAVLEDAGTPVEVLNWIALDFYEAYASLEKDPGPNTEKVLALVQAKRPDALPWLRGEFLVNYAWFARGSGYADTVTEDAWPAFGARLKEARKQLTMAWGREQNPAIALPMMAVCMGEGNDQDHAVWYNRGFNIDPTFAKLQEARMQMLCQKWGGSHEAMFAFARETLQRYKADPSAPLENALLIARAHEEKGALTPDAKAYLSRMDVYAEIKGALETALARQPRAMEIWGELLYYANMADDRATVKRAYEAQNAVNFVTSRRFNDVYFAHRAYERVLKLQEGKGKP